MALGHRADDDATEPPHTIGLRVLHRSSAYAPRAAYPARGYIKRAERREQYLKRKEELEQAGNSGKTDIRQWCPEEDVELCAKDSDFLKAFKTDNNVKKETTEYVRENNILDEDITFKDVPGPQESTSAKDEL